MRVVSFTKKKKNNGPLNHTILKEKLEDQNHASLVALLFMKKGLSYVKDPPLF